MRIAILILADNQTDGDLGRVVNALHVASELAEANDEVRVLFDGVATRWIGRLDTEGHRYHRLFRRIKPKVAGVCAHCAQAFGVREEVLAAGVPLLAESTEHPTVHGLAGEGFKVMTF